MGRTLAFALALGFVCGATSVEASPSDQPVLACYVDIVGALSREVVLRVFRLHRNEIRGCYQDALRGHPSLKGRLSLRVNVRADGTIESATATGSTLHEDALRQCVLTRILRFEFPAVPPGDYSSGHGTTINYGFRFEPRQRTQRERER